MGTAGEDGSILLNEILPLLVPVKVQGGTIVIVKFWLLLFWGLSLSLRVTVKVYFPDRPGVPAMSAVSDGDEDGTRFKPGGRLPAVMNQKYGVIPFDDPVNVAE
jgi:hypothetical protein